MASELTTEIYSFYQINVVGRIGGGKSTTGKLIAEKLGYPCIELDQIQLKRNWTESAEKQLFANLERSLKGIS